MILRSFLFVPADSERKLAKAKSSRATTMPVSARIERAFDT